MFYTGMAYFWNEKAVNYSDITGFCMEVKKHLHRGCMHIIIRKKIPPPLPQFSQCICWVFMMVTFCNKSLSTYFCTDHCLDWDFYFFFFSVDKVLYALVSLTWLSHQTETLCSFCRGCQKAVKEALPLQGTSGCLFPTGDWQLHLQMWIPGMAGECQYQSKHLYLSGSFVYIPKRRIDIFYLI